MTDVITIKGEPYRQPEIMPTNTRRFDKIVKMLRKHRFKSFHDQDNRLSEFERDVIDRAWFRIQGEDNLVR